MKRCALAVGVGIVVAAVLLLAPTERALAQQCATTGTNQTCTNSIFLSGGAAGLFDNATLTATNTSTGTILGTTFGVQAATADVTNSGSITGGFAIGAAGIRAATANVTNSGTISGQNGIFATFTNVINSGTISGATSGIGNGIVGLNTANVINSGTITGNISGIIGSVNVNVINTGVIVGGSSGAGISGGAGSANVTNSGIIAGRLAGIDTGGATNITNSGTISAPFAIRVGGGGDVTLTLLTGSKIIGAIELGSGVATVNVRAGNQNLTFDTLANATVTSNLPFVVSGNQVATIDPTQFAANGRVLGDFSRSVSQVVPDFDNMPAATGGGPIGYAAAPASPASVVSSAFDGMPGLQAYAADQAVFKAPTVVQADGTAIWARGFGGYRIQQADGVLLRTSSTFYGGALGFERQVRSDLRVGVFAGAGTTRSTIDLNSGNTDSNLGFGGLYARYFRGASFLYAAVQGGGSHNDGTRNVNNNLVAGGIESATTSYNGWYVSPELKLGHHIALGRVMDSQYTLTPSIGVRYLYGSFGGYTETGSTANLTVNSQTTQTVEERAELKLTRVTTFDARNALLLDITGGALGIQRVGSNIVNAALLGQSIPFATPGKDDVWGGFGGLGMEWRTNNVSLFASGEYLWLSDSSTVVSGKGGVRVAF